MDSIDHAVVGCSGNAWKGFSCDQSLFPQIVEDTAGMGDIFSLVLLITATVLCILFWIASLKMGRDLTKSFVMPIAAPVTLLLPVQFIHSLVLNLERKEDQQFFLTLEEGERYLQNVIQYTLLCCTSTYLLHSSAAAKAGSVAGYEIDRQYSYSSTYVLILFAYTVGCACLLPVFPKKFIEFVTIIIFGSTFIAYIAVILLFICAIMVFCICARPPPEPVYPSQPHYAGYSRLGGALLFTQIVTVGPMFRAVMLMPLEPYTIALVTNVYLLLRFLLPLILFASTFLFLPAYREAFSLICTPPLCSMDQLTTAPDIRQTHHGTDPAPRTFSNLETGRERPSTQYQARVENVEL